MISAFLAIGIVGSIVGIGYGALSIGAGAMSDDPGAGNASAASGVWIGGISLVVLVGCIVSAIVRHGA